MTTADRPHAATTRHADYDRITGDLAYRYDGVFSPETVERAVADARAALEPQSRIPEFLPILTERFAKDRLLAAAQAQGIVAKATPEILFVCVRNAGRSQMAAALAQHLSRGAVHVRSAGSRPGGEILPLAVEALAEHAIMVSEAFSKPLTDDVVRAADVIVTMGCGDACPVYPGKRYEDWDVADPDGQPIAVVRDIRDDLEARVRRLLGEIHG
jgi:protein-tyrosine-phosphatase